MKRILVVDDSRRAQADVAFLLGDRFELVPAFTTDEGKRLFVEKGPFDAIIVDGYIDRDPDTGEESLEPSLDLVRHLREQGFSGPMVANSMSGDNNDRLVEAGCSQTNDPTLYEVFTELFP